MFVLLLTKKFYWFFFQQNRWHFFGLRLCQQVLKTIPFHLNFVKIQQWPLFTSTLYIYPYANYQRQALNEKRLQLSSKGHHHQNIIISSLISAYAHTHTHSSIKENLPVPFQESYMAGATHISVIKLLRKFLCNTLPFMWHRIIKTRESSSLGGLKTIKNYVVKTENQVQ